MIPPRLYHYCSIDSFFHIVSSKSIWLCNSSQTNDSYENKWIEHYFKIVKDYFGDKIYEGFLEDAFDLYGMNNNPPFIFCLSANKDQLSQWRAYSHDGQGVAIGFNSKVLNFDQTVPSPNIYAHKTLGMERVVYSRRAQEKKILEFCKKIKESLNEPVDRSGNMLFSMALGFELLNLANIFKNPSFKEELEWRIIHTPTYPYKEPLIQLSELKFRLNLNRITTYFTYNFGDKFTSSLIEEVVIGPRCKMTEEELMLFLDHHNLGKTKVLRSLSTYR